MNLLSAPVDKEADAMLILSSDPIVAILGIKDIATIKDEMPRLPTRTLITCNRLNPFISVYTNTPTHQSTYNNTILTLSNKRNKVINANC